MDFKVYYLGGDTYHGAVKNTPIWLTLLIVEKDELHGRKIVSGGDYYVYEPNGKWMSVDYAGMLQYMSRPFMEKRFLVGVMVDSKDWDDVVRKARSDPDFPPQTALSAYETKAGF